MELVWEAIPNQKREPGRAINILKCAECTNSPCQYMSCSNYAVKTRTKKYKLNDWLEINRELLLSDGWTEDMMDNFIRFLAPKFPKGLYWESERGAFDKRLLKIKFVTMSRNGVSRHVGSIDAKHYNVLPYDLNDTQEKFLNRFAQLFQQVDEALGLV